MYQHSATIEKLLSLLRRLPGIGTKSGQRLVTYLLKADDSYLKELSEAIRELKEKVFYCSVCWNITDVEPCKICGDLRRDGTILCVVENPYDIISIEKTGLYHGQYHILHGHLSPIDGITPGDLKVRELLERLRESKIREVIIATNPTVEGESTAHYLAGIIKPMGVMVTRIGMGIPVGGDLEFADENTMAKALGGRREI